MCPKTCRQIPREKVTINKNPAIPLPHYILLPAPVRLLRYHTSPALASNTGLCLDLSSQPRNTTQFYRLNLGKRLPRVHLLASQVCQASLGDPPPRLPVLLGDVVALLLNSKAQRTLCLVVGQRVILRETPPLKPLTLVWMALLSGSRLRRCFSRLMICPLFDHQIDHPPFPPPAVGSSTPTPSTFLLCRMARVVEVPPTHQSQRPPVQPRQKEPPQHLPMRGDTLEAVQGPGILCMLS